MMMVVGPHTALGNIPRSIEYNVDWVTGLLRHMKERNLDPRGCPARGRECVDRLRQGEMGKGLLSNEINSWMTGVNSNIDGKQTRIIIRYSGSAPTYRAWCDEVAAKRYRELAME